MVVLQSISFANYALTTKTTNIIYGSAPYLTFDGGRTRVTNTEALLRISLSDGRTFTPTTNNSERNPIVLPVVGQSFNDIGMLVPTDTDSIALSSLIGTPYNYWGDDDGDGQGVNGVTATGRLNLFIYDKNGQAVARNQVLTICKAPYRLILSNTDGTLTTRYGVPNESRFSAGNTTYYINPKAPPKVCFAKPNIQWRVGPAWEYEFPNGFLTQSFTPSSYGLNFPTTGANKLYFDLGIGGINAQALSWATVSHGGITATVTYPYGMSREARVTLTGPVATPSQWQSENPGRIDSLSLPQTFELVGRDSSGNAVVKYGFVLKQWFVNRGDYRSTYSSIESWCNKIGGYRLPKVRDLTNASCLRDNSNAACEYYANEVNALGGTNLSDYNRYLRHIGGGLFSEWGRMLGYNGNFEEIYMTQDRVGNSGQRYFSVFSEEGRVSTSITAPGLCVYP
ncbi:hypothetical protein [Gilliamella apis]|uniref:hypothetical protein n=1 Tax=Gilliamella apis TaxID=1970738 RepID=UPI00080E2BB8|nr:hypothetical protein [Gilliamella apis]OCG03721.1 hypothetical protein A9G19_04860 [Gilliamella apis]